MGYSLKSKKILITCGPTWVPVDSVRVLSNQSTGALGQQIALDCVRAGAVVTLLEGPVVQPLQSKKVRVLKFSFFTELEQLIKSELRKSTDIMIHAAAVADYKLKKTIQGKLSSEQKTLKLELTATPKIINGIKRINPKVFLVGFKLEPKVSLAIAKLRDLFQQAGCDLVVANQVTHRGYQGYIVDKNGCHLASANSRHQMSKKLVHRLGQLS